MFKGVIYSVCILGTFLCGMALGDWQPVYYRWDGRHRNWGYFSQSLVGIPALPAFIQKQRVGPEPGGSRYREPFSEAFDASFEGHVRYFNDEGGISRPVSGILHVDPSAGSRLEATVDGDLILLPRIGGAYLEPEIYSSPRRRLECGVSADDGVSRIGTLTGTIPRAFKNWFQVRLDDRSLERLHGTLGKRFDLAAVFTWIAGLLNVLALWDALEGPAYGYGDEDESEEETEKSVDETARDE